MITLTISVVLFLITPQQRRLNGRIPRLTARSSGFQARRKTRNFCFFIGYGIRVVRLLSVCRFSAVFCGVVFSSREPDGGPTLCIRGLCSRFSCQTLRRVVV